MFESICIRRQRLLNQKEPLNVGFLAEALLFYEKVHLVADPEILKTLVSQCGPTVVMQLLEEGFLDISYIEVSTGTMNHNLSPTKTVYRPVNMSPSDGIWKLANYAPVLFSQIAGGPGWGRRMGRRFANTVPTIDITQVINQVQADYEEENYVFEAVIGVLRALVPTYTAPPGAYYYVRPGPVVQSSQTYERYRTYEIETNLDFDEINRLLKVRTKQANAAIEPSHFLLYFIEARTDLFAASMFQSEIATHEANSRIINAKFKSLAQKREHNQQEIQAFQKMVLASGNDIAEAMNMTYCTWSQFLELLRNARKFKSWLKERDVDSSLIQAYYQAVTNKTWAEKLEAKVFRFAMVTGIGFGATVPGIVLGAFDSFLVDKLVGGWRPNQFVDNSLKSFLRLG